MSERAGWEQTLDDARRAHQEAAGARHQSRERDEYNEWLALYHGEYNAYLDAEHYDWLDYRIHAGVRETTQNGEN